MPPRQSTANARANGAVKSREQAFPHNHFDRGGYSGVVASATTEIVMRLQYVFLPICLMIMFAPPVRADDLPPSTEPSATTRPHTPHIAVLPPGFARITVGTHNAFCQPADEQWVRDALAAITPATRPTTMPSDMTANIEKHRDQLVQMMMQELALPDRKDLDAAIDRILTNLGKVQNASVAVYYMPVTRSKLAELMRDGWSDPRFRYIRYANDVVFDPLVTFSLDQQTDDLVDWLEIHDDQSPDARRAALIRKITDFESADVAWFSMVSQSGTRNVLAEFITTHVIDPLKLPASLTWFGQGVTGVYAIKYAAFLSGSSRQAQISALIRPDPRNPLRPEALDLVNPLDPSEMRPQVVAVYNEAAVHRAVDIVNVWVSRGGDGVLARTLPVLRAHPPTNAADLIKTIRDATGIDLTPDMQPDYRPPS